MGFKCKYMKIIMIIYLGNCCGFVLILFIFGMDV